MSYSLSFELKKLPPSPNVYLRMHWRKRSKAFSQIDRECLFHVGQNKPASPLSDYLITFTRFTCRPLDIDNLVGSFKPVLDAIVRMGIITDDKFCTPENIKWNQVKVSKLTDQKIRAEVISKEMKNTGVGHG